MKIALFGSSGLIGSAIGHTLAAGGHQVVTVGRRGPADLIADLGDRASIEALALEGIDALIHAAGIVDEDFVADPARAFFQATRGVAALMGRAVKAGVTRLCYVSSAHVYGPVNGPVTEDTPVNPLSDYAIAHFASEQILHRACTGGVKGLVLRPNAVFGIPPDGDRFRRWGLIPFAFPRDAVTKQEIVMRSPGMQWRNFVATNDIGSVTAAWIAKQELPFQIINPVGATNATVREFAGLCAREYEALSGKTCKVTAPPQGDTPQDLFRYQSKYPEYAGRTDLGASIRELMALLKTREGV